VGSSLRYWKEFLFFSAILAVYIAGCTPDMTWMSLGGDMLDYVNSAEHMTTAGLMGYPIYVSISWLFVKLPGNPFWNLALFSSLATVGTCIFIYLIVKLFTDNKWAPYIGSAVYAGSFIVWTQSTIPEVYTFTAFLAAAGTYFVFRKRYYVAALAFAVSVGTHPLVCFYILSLLALIWYTERDWRLISRLVLIGCLGFLGYLQMVFSEPANPESTNSISSSIMILGYAATGLGTLPIDPPMATLERWYEILLITGASLGYAVPLLFFVKRTREVVVLGVIASLVLVFYATAFFWQWITYMTFVFLPLSILIGIGASRFPVQKALPLFLIVATFFIGYNLYSYDIGRNVDDGDVTTARLFYNEVSELSDDSVLLSPIWGQPGLAIEYHHKKEGRGAVIVGYSKVVYDDRYPDYRDQMAGYNILLPEVEVEHPKFDEELEDFAKDLQDLNPEKEVYVVYLKEDSPAMEFSYVPAYEYTNSLNDAITREEGRYAVGDEDDWDRVWP